MIVNRNDLIRTINNIIENSKYIFKLQDNWDNEGSIGYSEDTWKKSIKFIIQYLEWVYSRYPEKILIVPNMFYGKNGGIDFLWEDKGFKMLIRIDKNVSKGTFYATYENQSSEGTFNIDNFKPYMIPAPVV